MGYDLLRLSSKNVHLGTEPGAFCHCVPGLHARVRPERIGGLIDCHFPLHDGAGGLHVPGRALDGFLACGSGGRNAGGHRGSPSAARVARMGSVSFRREMKHV